MNPARILLLACFAAAILFSGCSRGAKLTVVNRSAAELTNVVASGSGFSESIGSIPAGGQRRVAIQPKGESGLQIQFDAGGKHFSSGPDGYLENSSHYRATAVVAPDFTVSVEVK